MQDEAQIIFVDTPGIFSPKRRLDRAMVNAAWQGAADNDVLLLLNDCARVSLDDETKMIIAKLVQQEQAAALILNKIDLATPEQVLVRAAELSTLFSFEKVFMISAHTGNGLSDLKSWLAQKMPLGPYLFDPNDLSDLPVRLLAAEILREKLFLNLHQELPYQMTVESESWVERKDGSAEVRLSVFVAREGHRGIVLGKRGQTIKRISQAARKELEKVLERRIHLMCHVKYRKDWMDDKERYTAWNLDFNA